MTPDTPNAENPRPHSQSLGEWSWEKHLALVAGLACVADAFADSSSLGAVVKGGALPSALLVFVLFYLSEMRYRLFKNLRND